MGLELRNRLEASLDITLPVALVWAHPTITDLAAGLCERMDYPQPADTQQNQAPKRGEMVRDRAQQRAAARHEAATRRKRGQQE
jgi:hypothetical protein